MKVAEIHSLRTRLKMTQQDLTSLLGFSVVSVNKWEGGETKATPSGVAALTARWPSLPGGPFFSLWGRDHAAEQARQRQATRPALSQTTPAPSSPLEVALVD